jgi:hypothetical protein
LKKLKSRRLKGLVTFQSKKEEEKGDSFGAALLPDFRAIIKEFEAMIQWKSVGNKKVPEPVKGLDEVFDEANE